MLIQEDLYTEQHPTSEIRAQLSMLERRSNDMRAQLLTVIETSRPDNKDLISTLVALREFTRPQTILDNLDDLSDLVQSCLVSL